MLLEPVSGHVILIITDETLEDWYGQIWNKNSRQLMREPPEFCEIYLQELDKVAIINIREKPLILSAMGGQKNPF